MNKQSMGSCSWVLLKNPAPGTSSDGENERCSGDWHLIAQSRFSSRNHVWMAGAGTWPQPVKRIVVGIASLEIRRVAALLFD